jgi:ankyrin repeat protein
MKCLHINIIKESADRYGNTALHLAVQTSNLEMTRTILDFSEKVLLINPTELLAKQNKACLTPLEVAKLYNHTEILDYLSPGSTQSPSSHVNNAKL